MIKYCIAVIFTAITACSCGRVEYAEVNEEQNASENMEVQKISGLPAVQETPEQSMAEEMTDSDDIKKETIADNEGDNAPVEQQAVIDYFEAVSNHYAYDYLGTLENGANLQKAYKEIKQICRDYYYGTEDMTYSFDADNTTYWYSKSLDYAECKISFDEAKRATIAVFNDCPLAYYAYTYDVYGNEERQKTVFGVDFRYREGEKREEVRNLIEAELDKIAEIVDDNDTESVKIEKIYNYLCETAEYDHEMGTTDHIDIPSHTIAGYATKHMAVCEGLSKTCQAALTYVGVDCITVSGYVYYSDDPNDHSGGHAWNMAYDGENWLVLDVASGVSGYKTCMVDVNNEYREKPLSDWKYDKDSYSIPVEFIIGK